MIRLLSALTANDAVQQTVSFAGLSRCPSYSLLTYIMLPATISLSQ